MSMPWWRAVRELAALARLEIHELSRNASESAALGHRAIAVVEQIDGDVELGQVGVFGSCQALKQHLERSPAVEAGQLRLDVGEHANLRRDPRASPHRIEQLQQAFDIFDCVDGRVDAQERVARGERQAPVTQTGDSLRIVGRMVRLQPGRQRARRLPATCGPGSAGCTCAR